MALYILERPSSWSTSRICLSWPWSRGRLSLLLVLFPQVYSCLLWPTQYLAVCSHGSYFALNPFLAYWQPNTSVQVNNMSALHHIHTDTHIYITSILLFILFFTPLPLLLAGWLPLTLPVGHNSHLSGILAAHISLALPTFRILPLAILINFKVKISKNFHNFWGKKFREISKYLAKISLLLLCLTYFAKIWG